MVMLTKTFPCVNCFIICSMKQVNYSVFSMNINIQHTNIYPMANKTHITKYLQKLKQKHIYKEQKVTNEM